MGKVTTIETQSVPQGVGWRRAVAMVDHDTHTLHVRLYDGDQLIAYAVTDLPASIAELPR